MQSDTASLTQVEPGDVGVESIDAPQPAAVAMPDTQERRPHTEVSLSRVGVTGVEKIIRVGRRDREQLYFAEFEAFVDLHPSKSGAHMSRFEETINEAIDEEIHGKAFRAESMAARIAERVRDRQRARRAEVRLRARYPIDKPTPISGQRTQEIYTLLGTAVANGTGTRCLVGVEAQGMTACPCAQELVAAASAERLRSDGFSAAQIERVFRAVPVATHNQRGIGRLELGWPPERTYDESIEAEVLLEIVESSMSSEIFELLKRPDEAAVVEQAHLKPRFVEDCVREMVSGAVARYERLGDDAFVRASQVNLETIHRHNVSAERYGTLGQLRNELRSGAPTSRHTQLEEWLEGTTATR